MTNERTKVVKINKVPKDEKVRRVVFICDGCGGKMSKGMTKCPYCGRVKD